MASPSTNRAFGLAGMYATSWNLDCPAPGEANTSKYEETVLRGVRDQERAAGLRPYFLVHASCRHANEVAGKSRDSGTVHNASFENETLFGKAMFMGRVDRPRLHPDQQSFRP